MEKLIMSNSNQNLTVANSGDLFIKSKKAYNLSEESIKHYERCIKSFKQFYNENLPICRYNFINNRKLYSVFEK
jgi:hypothetical protein